MPTSPEQLAVWLAAPEGPRLEFKEAKSNFHFDKLVDYSVALANNLTLISLLHRKLDGAVLTGLQATSPIFTP